MQLTLNYSPNVGGLETHLSDLVRYLVGHKYQVTVLTYRPLTTKVSWRLYERKANLVIFRLPWIAGLFYKLVKHPIFEFIYLAPLLTIATPFFLVASRIRVIHAHGLVAGFAACLWTRLFRRELIVSTHCVYGFDGTSLFSRFARFIFNSCDEVLCLSAQSKEEVVQLGVDPAKVHCFTNWVNTETFRPVAQKDNILFSKDAKLKVIFVGRLIQEKGVNELLDAIPYFVSDKIELAIIGSGPLRDKVIEVAKVYPQLKFIDGIDNSELPRYYSAADLSIVPSVHEEGFGRVIVESLACGVPVVASRRGAIPDILNEEIGIFTDTAPMAIAQTLNKLIGKQKRTKAMGKAARQFAIAHYGDKLAENIICYYKDR